MNQKEAGQLLDKYLQGKASQQEETIVQSWLMNQTARNHAEETPDEYILPSEMWSAVYQSIHQKKRRIWPRTVIAAAIAVIVFGAGLFYYNLNIDRGPHDQAVYKNDVSPGKVGATLTLANGKKIRLSDVANGAIAKEAGIIISKTADGQLVYEVKENNAETGNTNTLTTALGETYILTLPDKSKVWMNAASSLTYSATLGERGGRRVKLEGEAYFQITKDKAHPFVVESRGQTVEVLGTHFNVNSYADEAAITTTLIEGSVKVTANGHHQVIKPNEQALSSGGKITVRTVDVEEIVDWKDGDFYFNNLSLRNAMRKIARWYNVKVVYDASVPEDIESTGYISRTNKLSSVLKLIEKSGDVHFKIEGKTVYVSK
ncbi:FecR family protein [Pedobacter psychroterrae]|uniref:FecR family protein n=1 Tax=Pedobacter psychroterrae TaxID=2530453 RepID=A0A4R0NTW9_9SPHI|nr:FecR family protein [Pedobacter psychroterrae]TCD02915.1 FecR family protein [Pedobacter psychroterrae]